MLAIFFSSRQTLFFSFATSFLRTNCHVLCSSEGIAEGVSTITVIMGLSSSEGAPF